MGQDRKLKLFICYSHLDEKPHVDQFRKHIATLRENDLIEDWYDRRILAGEDYQDGIDNNLEDADIICLFVSANFLSSDNCKKEKKKALELRRKNGISVIPIILSACGWLDDKGISKPLALPRDGKPVISFHEPSEAWHDVYTGLKDTILAEIKIRQLRITEEWEGFLQDAEMLTKAHSQKERVLLDDIFIYPELDKYDDLKEHKETMSSGDLLENLMDYPKVAIAGEEQSGKTTLCKRIFKELRRKNFAPVYISDKKTHFSGKIENKILRSFQEQYERHDINEIDYNRIVPILDDFHFAKNKEKCINNLSKYSHCIVIVDDIFTLNIKDERLIGSFARFRIRELKPSLRYELIKKWFSLGDREISGVYADNTLYRDIDKTTELIDSTLGKTIGRGIMPAYPFFILSAIVAYETSASPLDQEITSQGYCYQAFVYFYLRKQNVRNDEIGIYVNFLTELAFYFYREKKNELSAGDFGSFMRLYLEKYNLPIEQETLLKNLWQMVSVDSFNNYSFRYPYLYYFFVAKYLAEHLDDHDVKKGIERIVNNLHVNENAYIAVFIAHHSSNVKILEEIELNAISLFDTHKPATLRKDEVKFFDERADIIIKAALPSADMTPEKGRSKKLEIQNGMEGLKEEEEREQDVREARSLATELRRAIKTVEVMGHIIKNRAGSLERTKLEKIYREAMLVHLRILSSFFELVKSEEQQNAITDFISEKLEKIVEKKRKSPTREQMEKISRIIFWNLNLLIVYGFVDKIVHSLGSDKLTEIVERVCRQIDTPASFLVRHGVSMWYEKSMQINEIAEGLERKDFSETAKRVMNLMVASHCSLHSVSYKDRQRIEDKLRIPAKRLRLN